MRTSRSVVVGSTILGLALILAVVLLWRDDAARVDVVDTDVPLPSIDDADVVEQPAPVPASVTSRTPASTAAARVEDPVTAACKATVADAVAFAEREGNAAGPPVTDDDESRYRAELEALPRSLIYARDPELFLAAFVLDQPVRRVANDPSAQATLLELGLRAAASDSSLLKWHALRVCAEAKDYCGFPHLEQGLLEALEENAEAWALAATLRYRRGDIDGALAAMQSAARASTSTWYWTETGAAIARALAEQTSIPDRYRAGSAGFAAAALPPVADSYQMCRAESATSRAWAEACLEFGKLREEHNETMAARGISYSMQKQALAAVGDTRGAEEAADAYALYRAEVSAIAPSSALLNALLSTRSEHFDAHMSAVREFGELEGMRRFIRREVPLLLERAGLLDRDGARECIAQFFEAPTPAGATFRDYPIESYPLQVGDELLISVTGSQAASLRVGPEGTIMFRRRQAIAAVGKTTGQVRSEIAALSSNASNPTPEVVVILMAPRSPEQRRIEFDEALREAKESR